MAIQPGGKPNTSYNLSRIVIGQPNGQRKDAHHDTKLQVILSNSDLFANTIEDAGKARSPQDVRDYWGLIKHFLQFGIRQTDRGGFPVINRPIAIGSNLTGLLREKEEFWPEPKRFQTKDFDIANQGELQKAQKSLLEGLNENNSEKMIQALKVPGMNVNTILNDQTGDTALILAIEKAKKQGIDSVIALLKVPGINIHQPDNSGNMPLHHAVNSNNPDIVRALIQAGADPNTANNEGDTPLHEAIKYCYNETREEIVTVLIGAGANPEIRNEVDGRTPMAESLYYRRYEMFDLLFKPGTDLTLRDNQGRTLLGQAIDSDAPVEIVQKLIEAGSDLNARDNDGNTLLHLAAQPGVKPEVLKLLIAQFKTQQIDLSIRNNHGKTPLEVADLFEESKDILLQAGVKE